MVVGAPGDEPEAPLVERLPERRRVHHPGRKRRPVEERGDLPERHAQPGHVAAVGEAAGLDERMRRWKAHAVGAKALLVRAAGVYQSEGERLHLREDRLAVTLRRNGVLERPAKMAEPAPG